MTYTKTHFDPLRAGGTAVPGSDLVVHRAGKRPEDIYLYPPRTTLALNLALATRRPLLISGEPGSGKTTLARSAASVLGAWFYSETVTSRTRAVDLLWRFDALRRLNDAQTRGTSARAARFYVEPGTLWWAFDPESAEHRGTLEKMPPDDRIKNPGIAGANDQAVVLLDEIDKADPDVPNDLLEPFDVKSFRVADTNDEIDAKRPVLLVLTTNGERELPPACLRRCVTLTLDPPKDPGWFARIADNRYPDDDSGLHITVADEVMKWRGLAKKAGVREPSTAEYLDAIAVCRGLNIRPGTDVWNDVARAVFWKQEKDPPAAPPVPPPLGV
jgi:MoxR-like ATPase